MAKEPLTAIREDCPPPPQGRQDPLRQTQALQGANVQLGDSSQLVFEEAVNGVVLGQSDLDYLTGHVIDLNNEDNLEVGDLSGTSGSWD